LVDGGRRPAWADLRGEVVLLDFWATWSAPCLHRLPQLHALAERFARARLRILSISYESREEILAHRARHGLRTQAAVDEDCATFRAFGAWSVPVLVVVGTDGRVVAAGRPQDLGPACLEAALRGAWGRS
jgi:thiol-disulfide isomerase/thioredoxin